MKAITPLAGNSWAKRFDTKTMHENMIKDNHIQMHSHTQARFCLFCVSFHSIYLRWGLYLTPLCWAVLRTRPWHESDNSLSRELLSKCDWMSGKYEMKSRLSSFDNLFLGLFLSCAHDVQPPSISFVSFLSACLFSFRVFASYYTPLGGVHGERGLRVPWEVGQTHAAGGVLLPVSRLAGGGAGC